MASDTKIDKELPETEVNSEQNNGKGEKETAPTTFSEKIKNFVTYFTVEPYLIFYLLPSAILYVPIQSFYVQKACRADLNLSEDICAGDNDTITTEIQNIVTAMIQWKDPLQSGIPAIVILFVGAWSDKTGNRKALMLIPILGDLISCIGFLLATYFFTEWPVWFTGLTQALASAFTGGISVALMGSFSYISDVTSAESRTFRMGVVAVIVSASIPVGSSISGILLELVGFYGVFGICAILFTTGIIYTHFRIQDVNVVKTKDSFIQKVIVFFNPKNAWDTLSVLFLSSRKELIQIWIVVWVHILVIGPVIGESSLVYLYVLKVFNMGNVEYSLFATYQTLMGLAGTSIAIVVLIKFLKIPDAIIGVIATSSKILSTFLYGFAPTKTWFYIGPIFDLFGSSGATIVRSLGTKVVSADKVGKMCSLIGFVELLLPVIFSPIFSRVYQATSDSSIPGTFYFVGGVMTVPAIFIFLCLYYIQRKQQRDVVTDPKAKELYAHENAVTVL